MLSGCGQINNEEDLNYLALTVSKSMVGVDKLKEIETPSDYPVPFNHPLKTMEEGGLHPTHVQMAFGEKGITDRIITVIFDELTENLKLVLVNEALEEVFIYESSIIEDGSVELLSGLYSYSFTLDQLSIDSHYLYGFVSDNTYSDVYTFDTWSVEEGTKFIVFGDLQGYLPKHYTAYQSFLDTMVEEESPQGLMLMGDVVDTGDVNEQWDYYYTAMEGISDYLPTITSIGNHDVKGSRENYENTFVYPTNGLNALSHSTGFYDLPYGRVAVIDTERPSLFAEQQAWLLEIMKGYDQGSKIVMMHRSVYPIFYVEPHMQVWSEIFAEADIDLVLSGHDHIYSRTTVKDVTYIVTGSGSGSKYYEQESMKPWQDFIFDANRPVSVVVEMADDALWIKTYSFIENGRQLEDQLILPMD